MNRFIILIFLFTGLSSVFSGEDILSDTQTVPDDPVRLLGADPVEKMRFDNVSEFAKLLSLRTLSGEITESEYSNLLLLLERDPGADELVSVVAEVLNKSKFHDDAGKKVAVLAEKNPDCPTLNLAAASLLGNTKTPQEKLPYVKNAWNFFYFWKKTPHPRIEISSARYAGLKKISADLYVMLLSDTGNRTESAKVRQIIFDDSSRWSIPMLLSLSKDLASAPLEPGLLSLGIVTEKQRLHAEFDSVVTNLLDLFSDGGPGAKTPLLSKGVLAAIQALNRQDDLERAVLFRILTEQENSGLLILYAELRSSVGDHATASRLWKRAFSLLKQPQIKHFIRYASELEKAGFFDEADSAYEVAVLAADEKIREALLYKIFQIHLYRKQFIKALNAADRLKDPFDRLRFRILSLSALKRYQDAMPDVKKFAELLKRLPVKERAPFLTLCGWIADKCNDMQLIEELFVPVVQALPKDHELLNFVGYTFADHRYKLQDARQYIERAVKLSPDNSAYLDSMAWVLYRLKDYESAKIYMLKSLKAVKKGEPDATLLDHAGDIFHAAGDDVQARSYWERALIRDADEDEELDREAIRKKLDSLKK